MRILFDHGTPRGVARSLEKHTVREARAEGWDTLSNGGLLKAAEDAGFDVLPAPRASRPLPPRVKECLTISLVICIMWYVSS